MIYEEVIIIGCGPCGMSTALELKKRGINPLIIEKGNIVNTIHSFPTHQTFFSSSNKLELSDIPFITNKHKPVRNEALAYYREVAKRNKLKINAYEEVTFAEKKNDIFFIKTIDKFGDEKKYKSNFLVVATGYHDQPNLLNVPGSSLPHVKHYFKEAHPYYNQKVAVIGGRNSAVDTALELYHANAQVTVLYRGNDYSKSIKPWILPEFASLVKHGKIKMVFNAEIVEINKNNIIYKTGDVYDSESVDFIFAMTGYHPQINFLKSLNVKVESHSGRPNYHSSTYETNVNHLYVAGVIISGYNSNETFIENGRHHGYHIAKSINLKMKKN